MADCGAAAARVRRRMTVAEYQLNGADRANCGEGLLNELVQALQAQGISNAGRRLSGALHSKFLAFHLQICASNLLILHNESRA